MRHRARTSPVTACVVGARGPCPHVTVDAIAGRDLLPHLLIVQRAAEKEAVQIAAEALRGVRLRQLDFYWFLDSSCVKSTPLK